jgi:hypothetical protein
VYAPGIDQVRGDSIVVLSEEVGCVPGEDPVRKVGWGCGRVVVCHVGWDVAVEL